MKLSNIGLVLLLAAYPVIVYFGLEYFDTRYVAAGLLAIAVLRLVLVQRSVGWLGRMPQGNIVALMMAAVCIHVLIVGSSQTLTYYPVLMNGLMFILFFTSLIRPPSIIEQFARIRTPDLPESGIAYTRKVTMIWCGYFVLNGSMAFFTSVATDLEVWAAYNGGISYALMGILFVGEYFIRCRVRSQAEKQPIHISQK